MRKKKMFAWLMALSIMAAGFGTVKPAYAEQTVTSRIEIQDPSAKEWEVVPGTTTHISIPVKTTAEYIYNPTITVTPEDENAPFKFSKVKLTTDTLPDGAYAIQTAGNTYINFDITTKESAKIKEYPIDISITWKGLMIDKDGNASQDDLTQHLSITTKITKEKEPAQLVMNSITYDEDSAAIGNNVDVSFEVRNEGEITALNSYVTFDFGDTNIIPNYANDNIKLGDIKSKYSKEISVPMKILNTATDGIKNIKAVFTYKDSDGTSYTSTRNIHLTVKKTSTQASDDAKLVINSTTANSEVEVGESLELNGIINNIGRKDATNVEVAIISGTGVTTGIVPNFESQTIALKDIAANKTAKFSLPLLVTNTAPAGLNEITVQVSYIDSEGNTKKATAPFFVTIIKPDEKVENSDVVITNVSQSPASPLVGQKITLTFDIENRGDKPITGVSVGADDLATSGFEPFSSQAYK
ncbi:MAG: hypothetical protein PUC65_11830, partial [Clostridiales bacterium]|nr:hypothetical protein [Clostridiales bacterium]